MNETIKVFRKGNKIIVRISGRFRRALSFWQPWASAIVDGPKAIDNRPRRPPLDMIGKVFYIHAAKKWDQGMYVDVLRIWSNHLPRGSIDQYAPTQALMISCFNERPSVFQEQMHKLFPFGALIGTARLVGVVDPKKNPDTTHLTSRARSIFNKAREEWFFGTQYGLILDEREPLPEPIPCRGHQGPWWVPIE